MSEADSIRPSPRRGMNGSSDGSRAVAAPGRCAGSRPRVAQPVVERRGVEHLALLGGGALRQQRVDLRQRLLHRLAGLRAVDQRRHLHQLEEARDGVATRRRRCPGASRRAGRPRADTVSSSSSRMIRKVECRPSRGPNSSSSNRSSAVRHRAASTQRRRAGAAPHATTGAARAARVIARCRRRARRRPRSLGPACAAASRPTTNTWSNSRPLAASTVEDLRPRPRPRRRPPRPRAGRSRRPP